MKVIQVNPKVTSWSTPGSANASGEIVDFGVNTAALVELSVPATACPLTLRMQFAEAIHENRTLYHHIVSVNKTKQHRNSSHSFELNLKIRICVQVGISTEISTFSCGAAAPDDDDSSSADGWVSYRSHWTQVRKRPVATGNAAVFGWKTKRWLAKTGLGQTQVQGKLKAVGVSHSDGLSLRGSDTALRRTFSALNAQHLLAVRLHGV